MLSDSGLLLDHFARLAVNVARTSAAVVGVLGQRKGIGPRRAAFGLSREDLATVNEIDTVLASGADLTVIPDLTLDDRFSARIALSDDYCLRFVAYMNLMSPAGERVGFICLLDSCPRPGLSRDEIESLDHIAGIMIADRKREQRHLHLMHVANRALRVDRMLRLISNAASCTDALTNLLEALCEFHGAAVGQIWQLIRPDLQLLEIGRYHQGIDTDGDGPEIESLSILNDLILTAIQRNKPHAIELPSLDKGRGRREGLNDTSSPRFTGHVCVPVWVQQQRFGISLAFTTKNSELDLVVADVGSLGDSIRPTLFQKVTEERMRFAAHHDNLTQLWNRLMFQERLLNAIGRARSVDQGFAVLCLDLDGFKAVNDTRGHELGDRLLVGVAQRLRESVRESDTVARMGGDEFAIIQLLDSQPLAAIIFANRLVDTVTRPFELGGSEAQVGVSIGIALYPQHGESPDALLRHADQALYRAKKSGRKTICLFDPAIEFSQTEHFPVEQDLRDAIEREDFTVAYQPVCDSQSLHIVGYEALLRWRHPLIGPIQPDQFIPLAERAGLILPLGRWALTTACAEAATWEPHLLLSVNLSPLQFRQPDLPRQVADVLSGTGLPAARLRLEVTEGLLLEESEHVIRTMQGLQAQGIHIILDDFGTAFASLSYLRRFPFNGLKIDKSFIRDLGREETTLAIVEAILSLGNRLKLTVVAEGVETESELEVLQRLGCRFFQGYLAGRPDEGPKYSRHQGGVTTSAAV